MSICEPISSRTIALECNFGASFGEGNASSVQIMCKLWSSSQFIEVMKTILEFLKYLPG